VHLARCSNQVTAGTMETLWQTRTKIPAHWPQKVKHKNGFRNWSTSAFSGRETKWLPYAWEDHVLNINLCVKFVITHIFTETLRKRNQVLQPKKRCKPHVSAVCLRRHGTVKSAATWPLTLLFSSISQLSLFQSLRCDDHLVKNLFLVCPTYCSWQIKQVAT